MWVVRGGDTLLGCEAARGPAASWTVGLGVWGVWLVLPVMVAAVCGGCGGVGLFLENYIVDASIL